MAGGGPALIERVAVTSPLANVDLDTCRAVLRDGLLNVALKWGVGVDKSGKPYEWMIDTRELLLQGPYLQCAARLLWEKIKKHDPQVVGGMTIAANPLTIGVMYESRADGRPVDGVIIRRERKADGLRKLVEGPGLSEGTRVVLLDDLVNSGATQEHALAALAEFQVDIVGIGVIVDYERAGSRRLQSIGYPLESLFTFGEIGMSPPTRDDGSGRLAWTWSSLNSGKHSIPKSTPRVFGDRIVVGGDRGFLLALSLQGKELWRHAVRDKDRGIHGTPCALDGKVYAGAYDGSVYCLDLATGSRVWEVRPGQWIGSSPAVSEAERLVYVGVEAGECSGWLSAIDADSGRIRWEMPTGDYVHSSPFFDASRAQVIVGCNDGSVYCADASSGRKRWEFPTRGEVKASATVDGDGVCFFGSFDGSLYAVDAETGKLRWSKRLSRTLYATPLIHRDMVIVGAYSSRVVALDRRTGSTRWIATTGGRVIGGAVALPGNRAAIASTDGRLYVLDADNGKHVWSYRTDGQLLGTPGTGGGLLLMPSLDGKLYAFTLQT